MVNDFILKVFKLRQLTDFTSLLVYQDLHFKNKHFFTFKQTLIFLKTIKTVYIEQ